MLTLLFILFVLFFVGIPMLRALGFVFGIMAIGLLMLILAFMITPSIWFVLGIAIGCVLVYKRKQNNPYLS